MTGTCRHRVGVSLLQSCLCQPLIVAAVLDSTIPTEGSERVFPVSPCPSRLTSPLAISYFQMSFCFAQEEEDEDNQFRTLFSDVSGWQGEGHGGKGAIG